MRNAIFVAWEMVGGFTPYQFPLVIIHHLSEIPVQLTPIIVGVTTTVELVEGSTEFIEGHGEPIDLSLFHTPQ